MPYITKVPQYQLLTGNGLNPLIVLNSTYLALVKIPAEFTSNDADGEIVTSAKLTL